MSRPKRDRRPVPAIGLRAQGVVDALLSRVSELQFWRVLAGLSAGVAGLIPPGRLTRRRKHAQRANQAFDATGRRNTNDALSPRPEMRYVFPPTPVPPG
jgi:hypothetical protein